MADSGADDATPGQGDRSFPWQVFVSELIGTALLVGIGLSIVIFMLGIPAFGWMKRRC